MLPVITTPKMVKEYASTIDHTLTNVILLTNISSGILETDISDHFRI